MQAAGCVNVVYLGEHTAAGVKEGEPVDTDALKTVLPKKEMDLLYHPPSKLL